MLLRTLAAVVISWTLLPLVPHPGWWVRGFDFPRAQVAALSALTAAAHVALIGWGTPLDLGLGLGLAACCAAQLAHVLRYTPLATPEVVDARDTRPDDRVRIAVTNVYTPNRNSSAVLSALRACDPDLILAVETDAWWESQLASLEAEYPHRLRCPLDNLYGMHLYSRLELHDARVRFLVEDDVPSIHATLVLRSGRTVALHGLHPRPPSPTENPTARERDGELLLVAREADGRARPTVVLGDLNDVAWSASTRLFLRTSGLLDPRVGRGLYCTFHARLPLVRWPLDHIFASPHFALVGMRRLRAVGSDHFPICIELQLDPEAQDEQDAPQATARERDVAEERIGAVDAAESI